MASPRQYDVLRKVFSFPILLGVLLLAGVFVSTRWEGVLGGRLFTQGDTWWHITVGEHILATGTWPTSDSYSFTVAGNDWIAFEWLGEVLMALAARFGGLRGLAALLVALSATLMLLLYYYAYLRSRNAKAAVVACALVLPLAAALFALRPHLIGWILLLITLICAERFRQGRGKALWILPGVFLVWVNTHGSFAFGLLVLVVYLVSGLMSFRKGGVLAERWNPRQVRQLLVVLLLCVSVLPLTPYGTRPAAYLLEGALYQPVSVANVTEWYAIDFSAPYGRLYLVLLLFFLAHTLLVPVTYRLEEIGLLLFAVYAASMHQRFLMFFALVLAPSLAALLARWMPPYQPTKDRPALNGVLISLVACGMVWFFPSGSSLGWMLARAYPQGAVDYMRQHPIAGRMLNEATWGGYLIWSLRAEQKVFIDGRADVYEYAGVLSDYLRITSLSRDTLFLLRKYNVEACLLQRDSPLGTFLRALPDWKEVYRDELGCLLVHNPRSGSVQRGVSVNPNPPAP